MKSIDFKCEQCGFCCETLLENAPDLLTGLSLFPEEINLFDARLVVPYTATGFDKPTNILVYQLTVASCPHLNKRKECTIYSKRPLVCKAFPLTLKDSGSQLAPKCPQIGHHSTYRENGNVFLENFATEQAMQELENRILAVQNELRKTSKVWLFDLATKKWVFRYFC